MCRRVAVAVFVCVCACVCVSGSIFPNSYKSVKKTYGSSQRCNRLIYNVYFFVKQHLREETEFQWQPYWCICRPFCFPLQATKRISIHMALFSTTWCFCTGFAIVFSATLYSAHAYLHHWTFTSTTCNRSPKGR